MNTALLEAAGLTKSEIAVYLALLDLGEATTGPITEKSGTASSKIYGVLDKLAQKGLVSFIEKTNGKHFLPAEPKRLLDYLAEKEALLAAQKRDIAALVPQLELRRTLAEKPEGAAIYRGMKGVETAFWEALSDMRAGEVYYAIGVPERSAAANRFFIHFNRERARRGVRMRILFDERARADEQSYPENNLLSEIRFANISVQSPVATNIFNDRVILFPTEGEDEPFVIVLFGRDIALSFRAQYEQQWNSRTQVYTGAVGPKAVFAGIKEAKGEFVAFGLDPRHMSSVLIDELRAVIDVERKGNIPVRLLYTDPPEPQLVGPTTQVKVLGTQFTGPMHVEIYGSSVAIIDWADPISTMIIDRAEVAEAYRRHFETLWKLPQAKPWARPH